MFDDIASCTDNPRPGQIINRPDGPDLYAGVPKDYTGEAVNVNNFVAALVGNSSATVGGSGKVVASGPDDHVFVFYTDHGGPGILGLPLPPHIPCMVARTVVVHKPYDVQTAQAGNDHGCWRAGAAGMPTVPYLFANDVVSALQKKHDAKGFKELVFYLEACESGSIFEGVLPSNISVFATTAANAVESSWGTYCPGMIPGPPPGFMTCLGDLYSVAWMEDSDIHNLKKETLLDQYKIVKDRTSNHNTYEAGSHVMMYGNMSIDIEQVAIYIGSDPLNDNAPPAEVSEDSASSNDLWKIGAALSAGQLLYYSGVKAKGVDQRDAGLLYHYYKYMGAKEGTEEKSRSLSELDNMISTRRHLDHSVEMLGDLLFGSANTLSPSGIVRPPGQPLVDDWDCLKRMVRAYEGECGPLTQYGMKHTRTFANLCNAGVRPEKVAAFAGEVCQTSSWQRQPVRDGRFSA
eukprot:SM000099S25220  [mRNA]  locus=s99:254479:257061:- [translate_table: standard]